MFLRYSPSNYGGGLGVGGLGGLGGNGVGAGPLAPEPLGHGARLGRPNVTHNMQLAIPCLGFKRKHNFQHFRSF